MRKIPIKPEQSMYNDDQWQAIHTAGTNILVSASAGSGKTKVLIERILYHIREKYASIDQLLVVTFTELAAKEMKQRMETSLHEAVSETLDGEEQRYLLDQVNKLSTAHIRTLHSFCLQVIQQFFYLIDFNPNVQLLTDETQKQLLYEEVWTDVVNAVWEGKTDAFTTAIDVASLNDLLGRFSNARNDDGLFNIVKELYLFASSHTEPAMWLAEMVESTANFSEFGQSELFNKTIKNQINTAAHSSLALLEQAYDLLLTLSQQTITNYEGTLTDDKNQLLMLLDILESGSLEKVYQAINQLAFGKWKSNSKKSDDYEAVNELKQLRDQAKDQVNKQIITLFPYAYEQSLEIETQAHQVIEQLSHLTLMFQEGLEAKKAEMNVIDYNDLEHLTLEILAPYNTQTQLREASIAATYYHKLFKEVLVDEYQDINEIQAAILSWLSHEQVDLQNNLFMVGDVKQSIYGFRMAEPSLFLNKYHSYQADNEHELIILGKNYRSRAEILEFANFIFERLMDDAFGEMSYGHNESLKVGNTSFIPPAPNEDFNIELLLNVKEGDSVEDDSLESDIDEGFDASIEAEAHLLAQNINEKMASGFLIYDKEHPTQKQRPLQYSDIVILTSTKFPFLTVQQVFESYGIPLYAQKVENFFQRQEVRLMIALLKIIDNPVQDIPLVAVLRSYFVNLSDEELSQIRIPHTYGSYYQAVIAYIENYAEHENHRQSEQDIYSKLTVFIHQLHHWQDLSQTVSLVELIWTIYQETNYLDYVAGLPNGEQRQVNLHALYERAAQFEQSSYKGVFGFVNYIEKVIQRDNDLAEPVLLDGNQNFVRIMTVHASKGLEFPVVYVLNMGKKFNLTDVNHKRYIASKNYGLGIDLYDYTSMTKYQSVVKQALKIEKTNQLKAEEMRKLYVAITRCEQKLILIGTVKSKEKVEQLQEQTKQMTPSDQLLIHTHERQKAQSWLDWVLQAMAVPSNRHSVANFNLNQVTTTYYTYDEIKVAMPLFDTQDVQPMNHVWRQQLVKQLRSPQKVESDTITHINQMMHTKYAYLLATKTSSYQSVSELKRLYEEPRIEKLSHYSDRSQPSTLSVSADFENSMEENVPEQVEYIQGIRYTSDTFEAPAFMQVKTVNYADIGTYTHFLLQQLDFSRFREAQDYHLVLDSQIKELVNQKLLNTQQVEHILLDKIIWFLNSDVGQYLIDTVYPLKREKAFSMLMPAKRIFKKQLDDLEVQELADDQLLIHGVIDNYVQLDDGSLLLIDYKTDRFRPLSSQSRDEQIETIKARYRFQISLYREALVSATQIPVSRVGLILLDFESIVWLTEAEWIQFS